MFEVTTTTTTANTLFIIIIIHSSIRDNIDTALSLAITGMINNSLQLPAIVHVI